MCFILIIYFYTLNNAPFARDACLKMATVAIQSCSAAVVRFVNTVVPFSFTKVENPIVCDFLKSVNRLCLFNLLVYNDIQACCFTF